MGKLTGFREYHRELPGKKTVEERINDFKEFTKNFPEEKLIHQAARCMDCGIPFCHSGCPVGNIIPDWNDFVYKNLWQEANRRLHFTNNFPEITGRICPAPCEEACVLATIEPPVTIKNIEFQIVEHAFEQGWIKPIVPLNRTGKRVAIIGSGPAGLACASQLNSVGHKVTVFEKAHRIGGLLRFGIPDFKLEKWIVDRRINLMLKEGVEFKTPVNVGVNYPVEKLVNFDAVVLCCGSSVPRDLKITGRELEGIHFAMDFLSEQNRIVAGDNLGETQIRANGKRVIVIGGGDTGSDCIGTSNRHRAKSIVNFELFPKPTNERPRHQPWPYWPNRLRATSSHEEGCQRYWSIQSKEFIGSEGIVEKIKTVNIEFVTDKKGEPAKIKELPGTEKLWPVDLVLLALGFTGPKKEGLIAQLKVELDERGNVQTDKFFMTNKPGVFSAGDMRSGQSLVVWAISEGRESAHYVDKYLMGESVLPLKGEGDLPRA